MRVPLRLVQRRVLLLALALVFLVACLVRLAPPRGGAKTSYVIHIWRHGERLKRRFLRSYGASERDPFEHCSVRNCLLTTDDSLVAESDAVLFHLHQTLGPHTLPASHPPSQVWVFFTDESPLHTFLATRKYTMRDYDGLFNWSMTYSSRSDVPVPYGRTVPLSLAERLLGTHGDAPRRRTRGVAVLGSNCGSRNGRWEYVRELRRHVRVDVFGACGNRSCPGHFTRDCSAIADYRFYLAFENSNCDEYLTEKLWWNAYRKGAVPVVMGAPRADYERLCPPGSFLHVDDYESPRDLARHLVALMEDDEAYDAFFRWKRRYKVLNEHGYFGAPSLHLCRLCEALNRGMPPKTYRDLAAFWDPDRHCHRSWR